MTLDEDGFASNEAWGNATKTHKYADPLRRIFDGFNAHVVSRGDVTGSFENGYLRGRAFFGSLSIMFATHGNLLQGETDGFAMSTRQELGPAVRGSDVPSRVELSEFGAAEASLYISREGHCDGGRLLALSFGNQPTD